MAWTLRQRTLCIEQSLFHNSFFQTKVGELPIFASFCSKPWLKLSKTIVFKICGTQTITKDVVFVIADIDNFMK